MMTSTEVSEVERVDAVVDGEAGAIAADDIGRYLALLTEDAVFLPPGATKEGADLRRWLAEFLRDWRVDWLDYTHDETAVEGDLSYHRFSYSWRLTSKTSGEKYVDHGKGLHVLRRGADGGWRIAREIWNARPEPASAPVREEHAAGDERRERGEL